MLWLALISGALGTLVVLLNFYTCILRHPIHKRLLPHVPYRHASGIPLIGSLLLIIAAYCVGFSWWLWVLIPGTLLDTGGFHVLAIAIGYGAFKR